MSPQLLPFVIFLLAASSIGALLLGIFYPHVAGNAADRRLEQMSAIDEAANTRPGQGARKRSVQDTLRELEEKQKNKARKGAKPTLLIRMRQADIKFSKNIYFLICAITGVACFVLVRTTALSTLPASGFAIAGGLLLPYLYVNLKRKRRFKNFLEEFPNAVDVIVRGLRSGLPLGECIKIIASDAQDPVKTEFKLLAEDLALGMNLAQAVERLPERMPMAETSFFAIVMAMQSETGGNLSEALANLSNVLRERKRMKAKIKAMSSEATASAMIIGAMPVMVTVLIYLTSPKYISLLFTTLVGNVVLVACGIWMLIGTLTMRKMINFDH
jgi:tight adherence protein B